MPPRTPDADATRGDARTEIIASGERLFAEHGIAGVSLREIMRASGQRNSTALQYHFGDRDGLLRAIVEKHATGVAIRRETLLDHVLGSEQAPTLRDMATVFVQPLVTKLDDTDGGAAFLRIVAQLIDQDVRIGPDAVLGPLLWDEGGVQVRISAEMEHLMPPGTTGAPLHRRFAAIRFAHIELGRRAQAPVGSDHSLFRSQLVDLFTALLSAPVSAETARLLEAAPRS